MLDGKIYSLPACRTPPAHPVPLPVAEFDDPAFDDSEEEWGTSFDNGFDDDFAEDDDDFVDDDDDFAAADQEEVDTEAWEP